MIHSIIEALFLKSKLSPIRVSKKRKKQRIYDLLNGETKPKFLCLPYIKQQKKNIFTEKELFKEKWGGRICNIFICRCMQKYIQLNKDERIQFFRKIYFSLYLKGFERVTKGTICERWVGDWTERQHVDPPPQLFWQQQHFFPVLLGCSTGGWLGAQPLLGHGSYSSIFSPTDLNFLSPGLYNNLTFTYFLRASQLALNSTLRQSRLSSNIFDRMHLLFTPVHFSSDSPAGLEVNMLQIEQKWKEGFLTVLAMTIKKDPTMEDSN